MAVIKNITQGFRGICPREGGLGVTLDPGEIVEINLDDDEIEDALATGYFEVVDGTPKNAPKAKPRARKSK